MSKKQWLNPELNDLKLVKTNEEVKCECQDEIHDGAKCGLKCKYGQPLVGCTWRVKKEILGIPYWICTYPLTAGDGTGEDNMGVVPMS